METEFRLTVNGVERSVACEPDTPLLDVLRHDLGLAGPKFGCGMGLCGACFVLIGAAPAHRAICRCRLSAAPLHDAIAAGLGLAAGQVTVHYVEGAGVYGQNGADDVAADAVLLARAVPGRAVRVEWTREDEMSWSPLGAGHAGAAVGRPGRRWPDRDLAAGCVE